MTNKPIHIFGDSFSFCPQDSDNSNDWKSWPDQLAEEFVVKNYSFGGSGHFLMYDMFQQILENNEFKENDKIIFVLSSSFRIYFDFLEAPNFNNVPFLFYDLFKNKRYDELEDLLDSYDLFSESILERQNDFISKLLENKEFFMRFFDMMCPNLIYQNNKNITYLKYISEKYKLKILTFRCFNESEHKFERTYVSKKLDFWNHLWKNNQEDNFTKVSPISSEDVNSKYFRLIDDYLDEVSGGEQEVRDEYKKCHMIQENNQIMVNIVNNFFHNGNFSEKFLISGKNTKSKPYIYE